MGNKNKNKNKTKSLQKKDDLGEGELELLKLPYHILHEIFTKLPLEIIHKTLRNVCKLWREAISENSFLAQTMNQNEPQLLVQVPTYSKSKKFRPKLLRLIEGNDLEIEFSDFGIPPMDRIISSCNGLVLVEDSKKPELLNVMNMETKFAVTLPPTASNCQHKNCQIAIGFDSVKKVYKVIHIPCVLESGVEILILGCDEKRWAHINEPFFIVPILYQLFSIYKVSSWSKILINSEILHWHVGSKHYIVSMEMTDVKSSITLLPGGMEIVPETYSLLDISGKLSLVHFVSGVELNIWILEDFKKGIWCLKQRVWSECLNFTSAKGFPSVNEYERELPDMMKLVPLGSVRGGEVMVLKHNRYGSGLYLLDMKHMQFKKFALVFNNVKHVMPHSKSLVCWKTQYKVSSMAPS